MPNWLREEIIKKKAVIGSSTQEFSRPETEFNKDEVMDRSFGKGDQVDVEYVEIKRLLNEVLLKVGTK